MITLIFTFSILLFTSHKASAALLYSQAANQAVYEGQTFVVDWFLDSEDKPINSVDLKLDFSKDTLSVVETSTGNSLISLWLKNPTSDNAAGTMQLTGGIPNGLKDHKIQIFRSVFLAKKSGTAFVRLDPESQILLNDGLGSSDQLKFKNLEFNIYPKDFALIQISSYTHPDQSSWYQDKDVVIKFNPIKEEDYSYSFSQNIEIVPDNQKQEISSELKFSSLQDGIYYFKLNSKTADSNWKEAGVYRVQIDNTAPEAFTPEVGHDPNVFGGRDFISFSTVDKTSGISHYKVKVGYFGRWIETQSPYEISKPLVGDAITIRAFDAAGNHQEAEITYSGYLSVRFFDWLLIAFGLIVLAYWFIKIKKNVSNQ